MINKRIGLSLAFAVAFLGTTAALKYAEGAGLIAEDVGTRAIQVIVGLVLAVYSNLMPKDIGRARSSIRAATAAQNALRVGGWSLTLAGLTYAGLWAFAPLDFADMASMVVVMTGMAVTLGYAAWSFLSCRLRTSED
jgi:hypothetical protein